MLVKLHIQSAPVIACDALRSMSLLILSFPHETVVLMCHYYHYMHANRAINAQDTMRLTTTCTTACLHRSAWLPVCRHRPQYGRGQRCAARLRCHIALLCRPAQHIGQHARLLEVVSHSSQSLWRLLHVHAHVHVHDTSDS